MIRSWLREPLLQFAIIGGLIFAVDAALTGFRGNPSVIEIDDDVRAVLAEKFTESTKRTPTEAEMSQLIEGWVQQEVFYREGVALGLDRSDQFIRERVITLVRSMTMIRSGLATPTEQELLDYFATHQAAYVRPGRYDLVHFIVRGTDPAARAEADELLTALRQGGDPQALGRRLLPVEDRTAAQLSAAFGDDFPKALATMAVGQWHLIESPRGFHVLRLDAADPGGTPTFDEIRDRVLSDWQQAQKLQEAAGQYRDMRQNYTIVGAGEPG